MICYTPVGNTGLMYAEALIGLHNIDAVYYPNNCNKINEVSLCHVFVPCLNQHERTIV